MVERWKQDSGDKSLIHYVIFLVLKNRTLSDKYMDDIRDIEISKDNLKVLEDALKKDANPDVTMDNGKTYLYNAVEKGEKEIVELLLKYNANPRKKSRISGDTALHAAIE